MYNTRQTTAMIKYHSMGSSGSSGAPAGPAGMPLLPPPQPAKIALLKTARENGVSARNDSACADSFLGARLQANAAGGTSSLYLRISYHGFCSPETNFMDPRCVVPVSLAGSIS